MRQRLRDLSTWQASLLLGVLLIAWLVLMVAGFAHSWLWLVAGGLAVVAIGLGAWADS